MKIVMSGPKCSGKSNIGQRLAEIIGIPFFETDELIEKRYFKKTGSNLTCKGICAEIGDDDFRTLEKEAVEHAANLDWCVLSIGGSTLMNRTSRQLLRNNSILVLLYASAEILLQRFEDCRMPAYLNNKTTKDLFICRAKLAIEIIEPFADISIDSSTYAHEDTLTELLEKLKNEIILRADKSNTFGQIVSLTTFGESHGKGLGAVLDGIQPGINLSEDDIQKELNRRKPGQSSVSTSRKEADKVKILSGVFEGKTTGTPIGMIIENKDQDSSKYDNIRELFRPGTADYTFWKKYGLRDHRGGGRSSGRETASRVMGGAVAKKTLTERGVTITAHSVSIAGIDADKCKYSDIEKNSVRCADSNKAKEMETAILAYKNKGDSVGGIVQIDINGLPAGLGNPVFGKINARLGMAILSIGAVKGIEFGDGFKVADKTGSQNNDSMCDGNFISNHTGGILGGISNGEQIIIKAAVKPTPSIYQEQKTSKKDGSNTKLKIKGRHDPCILPRIIPVMESMTALVILDLWEQQERINPSWNK